MKFIHFEEGRYYNQLNTHLIDYCVEEGIPRFKILIMPLTPKDPTGVNAMVWSESKDKASQLALKHHFRYSPRIHIDRKLD